MYERFGLVLMMTHACNLRCTYCYTGEQSKRSISREAAQSAIERAVRSVRPQGTLELGFFGGESLLKARLVLELIEYAHQCAAVGGVHLQVGLTTNGTLRTADAWKVMTLPGMQLTVSHDGLPEVHDRHRRFANGRGSSRRVMATLQRLQDAGRNATVMIVVRPDGVELLPDGIAWLRDQGVRHVDAALDLWTDWTREDAERLQQSLARCADLWYAGLPEFGISWFDEKAAHLTGVDGNATARCGFGDGEIAVAPSGNLYPCERLIGEDAEENPMRLPGHALNGSDFRPQPAPPRSAQPCGECTISTQCSTTCRCSNYVRTGDVGRPDGLLCTLDTVLYRETARVLRKLPTICAETLSPLSSLT